MDRNVDILRDLKRTVYSRRKGSPVQHYAVLDASSEDLGQAILGRIVYAGTSKAQMLISDAEFRESQIGARTRIVQLKSPLPVGALVTGNDLMPVQQ